MELKDQIASPILSKQLSDLGIKGSSLYYWVWNDFNRLVLQTSPMIITGSAPDFEQHEAREYYSAFSVAELGEMLPTIIQKEYSPRYELEIEPPIKNDKEYTDQGWIIRYRCKSDGFLNKGVSSDSEANARAKMLICLKENKLI